MHGLSEDNDSKSLSRLQFMESMKVSTMRFLSDRLCFWNMAVILFGYFLIFDSLVLTVTGEKVADFYGPLPVIIRELLHRLNDDSSIVLKANQMALNALTSLVPSEELVNHLQFIRNLIASMVSDARYRKGGVGDGEFLLPGFNIPKGKYK